jgi:hypothetical protein
MGTAQRAYSLKAGEKKKSFCFMKGKKQLVLFPLDGFVSTLIFRNVVLAIGFCTKSEENTVYYSV